MGSGPERRCVGRVSGLEGAVRESHGIFQTGHTAYTAALRTTTHLQTGKTICCNLPSSAPDDGHKRPKHVELKKLQ